MHAVDVMTSKVITVTPDTDVREIARLLLEHHISAVPVVDDGDKVLGIVSEGDLMRRVENNEGRRKSWWLRVFAGGSSASDYVKSHARRAREIMTADPITIEENEPLHHVAKLLEKYQARTGGTGSW